MGEKLLFILLPPFYCRQNARPIQPKPRTFKSRIE